MRASWKATLISVAGLSAATGGALGHWGWPRDARAQSHSSVSTVFVPPDGLIFRSPDGRAIARLARDESGGVIELYDNDEQVTSRLTARQPTRNAKAPDCTCTQAPQSVMLDNLDPWRSAAPPSVMLDDDDPWKRRDYAP
jgi:hypothetical protein